jgi:hypothetical protein
MTSYLDPRTLNVGDTLISRDFESEVRVTVEKVEFAVQGSRKDRYVLATISGGGKAIKLTGSGGSVDGFRPDGTCSIYQTGNGLSLEVVRKGV